MATDHGRPDAPRRSRGLRRVVTAALCVLLLGLTAAARAQDTTPAAPAAVDSMAAASLAETEPAPADSAAPAPAAAPAPHASATPPPPDFESGSAEQGTTDSEPAAPAPVARAVRPANLTNVDAWTEYKLAAHLLALPQESRLFYRRALMLRASGGRDEAIRLARGAIKLDPGYVAPRLTLAAWLAFRSGGEALEQISGILRIVPDNFMIQIVAANNALYLALQALFLAILSVALIVVALDNGRLRHGWMERLASFVTADTARWWSWAILIGPFLAGVGPALPTLVLLGLLWPSARLRERSLFVLLALTLAGVPAMSAALDRLSAPLDAERGPFYGVPQLQTEPYSSQLRAEFDQRLAEHPDSPFLRFAAGWLAQRAGDLTAAEVHYRGALELWPDDDRVLNNLGNALAGQGRNDEAVSTYHRAIAVNPRNPSAHFNLSQIYTMRFDFHTANEELARASALDFEMVKALQTERAETRWAGLTDQWIHPRVFWRARRPRCRRCGAAALSARAGPTAPPHSSPRWSRWSWAGGSTAPSRCAAAVIAGGRSAAVAPSAVARWHCAPSARRSGRAPSPPSSPACCCSSTDAAATSASESCTVPWACSCPASATCRTAGCCARWCC